MKTANRLRDRLTSARTRAVLSLGIVLGLTSVSTLAYWTDSATMTTGQIQSGTLDLQLNGNLPGQNGTWNNTALSMANMVPGESVAVTVPVQRAAGTIGFTYTAKATAAGDLAPSLTWTVTAGSAGTPATNANGIRTNTCGGTQLWTGTLSGTESNVIATARTLADATMSENVCIRAALPTGTTAAAMGKTASASFVFNATQLQ